MKPLTWILIAAAAALVLLYLWQQRAPLRPPAANGLGGGGASILDSLNAGASKLRTLFSTIGGSTPVKPPATDGDE